jgi:hypothetical protein
MGLPTISVIARVPSLQKGLLVSKSRIHLACYPQCKGLAFPASAQGAGGGIAALG